MSIPVQIHPEAHLASIGDQPHVFHCRHPGQQLSDEIPEHRVQANVPV